MAYVEQNVSTEELALLSSGVKQKASKKRSYNLLVDFGVFLAHAGFYPLALIAAVPEFTIELVGTNYSLLALPFLLLSAAVIVGVRECYEAGPLARLGIFLFTLGLIVLVPAMLGFAALVFLMFALTGVAMFGFIWKGVLFFGFLYWYLSSK